MSAVSEPRRRLEELHEIRTESQRLNQTKSKVINATQRIEKHEALMSEMSSEQRKLFSEKLALVDKLRTVQSDMENIRVAQRQLRETNRAHQEELKKLRQEQYEPLKDRIDALRQRHGLGKLPNVQDEIENETSKYLQERRERWRESGLLDAATLYSDSTANLSPAAAATPNNYHTLSTPGGSTYPSSSASTPSQSPRRVTDSKETLATSSTTRGRQRDPLDKRRRKK
ncbi:hypothetical protein DFS34DRAFT_98581 [Phlyctochytrium arcticum]|nr:hypothetical protein DFS34DRAFT_98581 [Phlyctochytrium arcticum]